VGQFGVTLRSTSVEVEITADEKARYRVLPKNKFDDKGKLIPFKPDTKDPDWKLGGNKGEFKDIEKDAWVTVRLRRSGTRTRPGNLYLADLVVILGKEEGPSKPGPKPKSQKP
jgi:hypothetical protein